MNQKIGPGRPLKGTLVPPGDKSVSHRALLLASMATDPCSIKGVADGEDVETTANCLRVLGSSFEESHQSRGRKDLRAGGISWQLSPAENLLQAGNSGTTMRLLAGALAGVPQRFTIDGDASLRSRPMERVAEPLRLMGADVSTEAGKPPISVAGGNLSGIHYELPVASAQVKGAILLAALQAEGRTTVDELLPSRDHTERLLSWLGVDVTWGPTTISIEETFDGLPLPAFELTVPGDFSSAAYALVAAAIIEESELSIDLVGTNFSRTGLIDILREMGAAIVIDQQSEDPEPLGSIYVRPRRLQATIVSGEVIPRAIDELPLIAVAATQAEGTTVIRDAAELRTKESDRVAVLAKGLRAMGAEVEEFDDGLAVSGPVTLRGAVIDSAGDHRIAMAFAVAGLLAGEDVEIEGWECARISYPSFLQDISELMQ